jgi:hypothetical protein
MALAAPPGPIVGLAVATTGLVMAACVALAARILIAFDHARRTLKQDQRS